MRPPLLLAMLALLAAAAAPARGDPFQVFVDDRAGFEAAGTNVVDSDGSLAPDPALGSVASVSRSGTLAGEALAYALYDIQFSTTPTGRITPGTVGDDVGALSTITVESPAAQSGGVGSGSWGVDSGAVSTSRKSGLLIDVTTAPTPGITRFGVDLIDFEADVGSEGELRLYAAGLLVYSTTFALPPDGGDDAAHFLGVVADPASGGVAFDQVVVLVGTDSDRWAADRFTFGVASTPEPGTWALFGLGLLGLGTYLRRRRLVGATQLA